MQPLWATFLKNFFGGKTAGNGDFLQKKSRGVCGRRLIFAARGDVIAGPSYSIPDRFTSLDVFGNLLDLNCNPILRAADLADSDFDNLPIIFDHVATLESISNWLEQIIDVGPLVHV